MAALEYRPYFELTRVPNVIADGHPRRSTVLTLSHWPNSSTPDSLKRDLSAEIALAYLSAPEAHVEADVVSNNHFDIDGFMAVWALTNPTAALDDPQLVAEVARAGDFGWTDDDRCARVAFALGTLKTPGMSPLGKGVFDESEPHQVANLYRTLLDAFDDLVATVDQREELWRDQVAALEATDAGLRDGRITIDESPKVDLAVVNVDPTIPAGSYPYCIQYSGPCHPMPIYRATHHSRILYVRGNWVGFVYRFESWVDYRSRPIAARVDLTDLARRLTGLESEGGRWVYAWPNNPNPPVAWLATARLAPTTIPADTIVGAVKETLASGVPASAQGPSTYS